MIAQGTWQTANLVATDDDVINEIREAIARRGYQVGECVLTERNHNEGEAHVEIYEEIDGEFTWLDTDFQVEGIIDTSLFMGEEE